MLSNLSSGAEDDGAARGSGVRRITKRKTTGDSGPRISRLGAKKVEGSSAGTKVVKKLGDKTPKSDRSLSEAGSEEWSEIGSEEMNAAVAAESSCVKQSAYKCGPVDKDEVMSRLRNATQNRDAPKRETDWVIEERIERDIVPKVEEFSSKKFNLDEIAPPPPPETPKAASGGQWNLKNSWLGSVSRSVASLTAKVSQNVSTALDSPTSPNTEDFRSLVHERLHNDQPPEERVKGGRKYLYEAGIDDSFKVRPQYGRLQEEKPAEEPQVEAKKTPSSAISVTPSVPAPKPPKPREIPASKPHEIQAPKPKQSEAPKKKPESDWGDDWGADFEPIPQPKTGPKPLLSKPKPIEVKPTVEVPKPKTEAPPLPSNSWEDESWNDDNFEPVEPIVAPKAAPKSQTLPPKPDLNETEPDSSQQQPVLKPEEDAKLPEVPKPEVEDAWNDGWGEEEDLEVPTSQQEVTNLAEEAPEDLPEVEEPVCVKKSVPKCDPVDKVAVMERFAEKNLGQVRSWESTDDLSSQIVPLSEFKEPNPPTTEKILAPQKIAAVEEIPKDSLKVVIGGRKESTSTNESWNDWDHDLEKPHEVKTPHPERPSFTVEGEEVRGAPKFNLVDKLKIEERIKQSLSLEVSKFYEQESAHEWDDEEEWVEKQQSGTQEAPPSVVFIPRVAELPLPPPPLEDFTDSDASEEEEDEEDPKKRRQTKQKSVQECIELLKKNRAELEQRKQAKETQSEESGDNWGWDEEEKVQEAAPEVPKLETTDENWGWEDEPEPRRAQEVQILETPTINLVQSVERTTETPEERPQVASWEDEDELSPVVANAVHASPQKVPEVDAWNDGWSENEPEEASRLGFDSPGASNADDSSVLESQIVPEYSASPYRSQPRRSKSLDTPEATRKVLEAHIIQKPFYFRREDDDDPNLYNDFLDRNWVDPGFNNNGFELSAILPPAREDDEWRSEPILYVPEIVEEGARAVEVEPRRPPRTNRRILDREAISGNLQALLEEREMFQAQNPSFGRPSYNIVVATANLSQIREEDKEVFDLEPVEAPLWPDSVLSPVTEENEGLELEPVWPLSNDPLPLELQEEDKWGEADAFEPVEVVESVKARDLEAQWNNWVSDEPIEPVVSQETLEAEPVEIFESVKATKLDSQWKNWESDEPVEGTSEPVHSQEVEPVEVLESVKTSQLQSSVPNTGPVVLEEVFESVKTSRLESQYKEPVASQAAEPVEVFESEKNTLLELGDKNMETVEAEPVGLEPVEEPICVRQVTWRCGDDDDDENLAHHHIPPIHAVRLEPIGASREDDIRTNRKVEGQEPSAPEIQNDISEEADESWDDWSKASQDAATAEPVEERPAVQESVQAQEPEGAAAAVLADEDDEEGDGWGDWGDSAPQAEVADGDGWEETKPAFVLQPQSSESAEDGWDDWGDLDSQPVEREAEVPQVVEEEVVRVQQVPQEAAAPPTQMERQQLENIFSRLENKSSQSQWSWKSNFGLSLLANASKNVASLTAQVSQNLTTALDVPNPEDMAKIVQQDEERRRKTSVESDRSVSSEREVKTGEEKRLPGIKKMVTNISSKVITGGLDTLEGIGKKTITMIQEKEGIISKTKQLMMDLDRKVADSGPSEQLQEPKPPKLPDFETLFDDYHGLVHFEALKLLSQQAQIKIEMLLESVDESDLEKVRDNLQEVEEMCVVPEASEVLEETEGQHTPAQLEDRLTFALQDLDVEVKFEEVGELWKKTSRYLDGEASKAGDLELHERALDALASFTALAMFKLQELADGLSTCRYHSAPNEADALISVTNTCYWHINGMTTRFTKLLNHKKEPSDELKRLTTNVFLEASNANSYIQESFKLLIPIIQVGSTA